MRVKEFLLMRLLRNAPLRVILSEARRAKRRISTRMRFFGRPSASLRMTGKMFCNSLFIALVLSLSLNNLFAEGMDNKAKLRYQAMEQEMDKLAARREKAMEEAIRPRISKDMAVRDKAMDEAMTKLTQKKSKERFFFIQKPGLSLLALRQNPLMLR